LRCLSTAGSPRDDGCTDIGTNGRSGWAGGPAEATAMQDGVMVSARSTHTPDPAMISGLEMQQVITETVKGLFPPVDDISLQLSTTLKRAKTLLVHREEREVHRDLGCTPPAFQVLAMLWIFGPMPTRELCRLAGISRQAAFALITTLEKNDLVEKRPTDGEDRRLVSINITEAGRDVVQLGLPEQNRCHARFFSHLDDDEKKTLLTLLSRLVN